jgi:hypothetical protein
VFFVEKENLNEAIELGSWLGRKQAFSGMAGRCSAADAQCLLNLRRDKRYQASGLTWDEFCKQRVGISRSMADRTIRLLEEFGETYFYLNGLTPVSPQDYRLIAGSVSGDGVQYAGESIAIAPQNAAKLAEAVDTLRRTARLALPAPSHIPKDALWEATRRLQDAVTEMEQLLANGPGNHDRAVLFTVLGGTAQRLGRLDRNLR